MAENKIAISVNNVSKDFVLPHEKVDSVKSIFVNPFYKRGHSEAQHALKDISFDIHEGEFFGIVGRNGSGKSTLLKIIAGIYQPTKGNLSVRGRLVPFIELGVGFNPELTGRENVYLNGSLMGFSTKEVNAKYDAIVDFAELKRFMDQKLKNYSSGMQVRLAFSVATILADSDVLLIDEVLAVGDADFQRKCFDYFRKLKKNKKTVVFVSHDMNAVREYCDRAVLIEGSELILEGKADKIATAYTKMFIEQAEDAKDTKQDGRWGDERAVFESVKLSSKKLTNADKTLSITTTAVVNEDIENPILGFSIKNAGGMQLMGTNNKIKKQNLPNMKKGDHISVTWKVPNVFTDGKHYVDIAIVYRDGSTIADWWEESVAFNTLQEENTPYVVTPPIELEIHSKRGRAQ